MHHLRESGCEPVGAACSLRSFLAPSFNPTVIANCEVVDVGIVVLYERWEGLWEVVADARDGGTAFAGDWYLMQL